MRTPEIFVKDGFYWTRFLSSNGQIITKSTGFRAISAYKRKASRAAQKIAKQSQQDSTNNENQTETNTPNTNQIHYKLKDNMDLIRILRNRIHLDFRYTCPKSSKRKRIRKATGLVNSQENRLKAQQMALTLLNELSQPKPSPQDLIHQKQNGCSKKSNQDIKRLFELYQKDDRWFDLEETSKVLYERYFRVQIYPFFQKKPLQDISLEQVKQFRRHLANSKKTEQNGSKTKYSGKYLNQILSFFYQLLRFAFREQILAPFDLSKNTLKKFKESDPEVNALSLSSLLPLAKNVLLS